MDVAGACSGCDQRAPCPGRLQPLPPCSGLLAGVRSPWEVPNAAASGPWPRLGGAPLSLQVPSQVGTTQPRGQGVLLGCSPGCPRAVKPGDDARDRMRWALSGATQPLLWSPLWPPHAPCGRERAAPWRAPCRALRCAARFSPPLGLVPSPSPPACAQAGPLPALPGRAHRWRGPGPAGGQVWPHSAAGGCASPPLLPPCFLLSQCQCKGGISVQNQSLQHLIPCTGVTAGGFGPAHPEVASRAGGGRSGLSVRPQDGTRPPQPSQLREATVTRARPSTPLLQAQPALLPVLFLKEFLVLFQCRGLCTVLIPRFPSLFYCTIMAVAGSWCNMEVL